MIVVISATGSNLGSVTNALKRLDKEFEISNDVNHIKNASHVILPGVGTAQMGMQNLARLDLIDVIKSLKVPVLGICLGMQLLFEYSQESNIACLGIIPGVIKSLSEKKDFPIPHMGWDTLNWKKESALRKAVDENVHVYFVHSFAAPINETTLASCDYTEEFSVVVQKDNFYGMQFHPEKSSTVGLQLLKNFCEGV